MDDRETANRRARLRELIEVCFNDRLVDLQAHIRLHSGTEANQGELSALRKAGSSKSFGDKKAKTLAAQIGLHRRWFDWPVGTHTARDEWLLEPSGYEAAASEPMTPRIEGMLHESVMQFTPSFSTSAFNTHRAPVVSWGRMGVDVLSVDSSNNGELVAPVNFGDGAVVWRVEDDSMSPDYNPGDFIAIDSNPSALKDLAAGEAVIVETSGGTKILRYYTPLADGHFEARPPASSRYGALSTLQMPLHLRAVVQAHLRLRRTTRFQT